MSRAGWPRRCFESALTLLVRAHEPALGKDVAFHGLLDPRFRGLAEVAQDRVQRVELVEVAVAPDGRAGPTVAGAAPVVAALASPRRERAAFQQARDRGRDVVE